MYRINVYNLAKVLVSSKEVEGYPTAADIGSVLDTAPGDCFVDICRSKAESGFEDELGFTDELQVDLIEGNGQYA